MLAPLQVLSYGFHQIILTNILSVKNELLHTQLIDILQMKELKHGLIMLFNEQPTCLMLMQTELGFRKYSQNHAITCTVLLIHSGRIIVTPTLRSQIRSVIETQLLG